MKGLLAVLLLALAGCAADPIGVNALMDNKYMERTAEPVPKEMAGTWTGVAGPYLMTMIIQPDGTGVSCGSWHKHNSTFRIKHQAGMLYFSDGSSMIADMAGDHLVLSLKDKSAAKFANMPTEFKYYRDDALKEAAPYCRKELS